jgi:outer membrane lipoprotein
MPLTARVSLLAAALAVAGCAAGPQFDTKQYDRRLTPAQAVQRGEQAEGSRVLWGGMIINTSNLDQGTEVEALAYPLGASQRPDTRRTPLGRFIIHSHDYLESVDFAPGRLITVAGPVSGTREGKIGDSRYVYPVVEPETKGLYLWPAGSGQETGNPRFSIGVGVLLGH